MTQVICACGPPSPTTCFKSIPSNKHAPCFTRNDVAYNYFLSSIWFVKKIVVLVQILTKNGPPNHSLYFLNYNNLGIAMFSLLHQKWKSILCLSQYQIKDYFMKSTGIFEWYMKNKNPYTSCFFYYNLIRLHHEHQRLN